MGKGKAGRKRKDGKRTAAGRLSRSLEALEARYDKGSDWAKARQERFGSDYNSAIGRAFASGLLGEGNDAKDRYDKARKFISLYRAVIGRDRYRCALNQAPRGMDDIPANDERDSLNQDWLLVNMARIDETGCRPFFDQITSHLFTDYGPQWLDRLLDTKPGDRRDTIVLDAALRAIDAIGPVDELAAVLHSRVRRRAA